MGEDYEPQPTVTPVPTLQGWAEVEVPPPEKVRTCPYRWTKGKPVGGCGHHDSYRKYDEKGGCERAISEGSCPILGVEC
jgi:hypothetical protein